MGHVEFVGPPGVGKSTIHSRLVTDDSYFGGTAEDATRRLFLGEANIWHRLPYRVMPRPLRSFVKREFIKPRLRHRAFASFVAGHPNFTRLLSVIAETGLDERETLISMCAYTAACYQLGLTAVHSGERLCVDEGFAQRLSSILWRTGDATFPVDRYCEGIPVPDLVIHVTAPPELCLDRQRERGSKDTTLAGERTDGDSQTAQEDIHDICRRVADVFADRTSVVRVENTDSVAATLSTVVSAIERVGAE